MTSELVKVTQAELEAAAREWLTGAIEEATNHLAKCRSEAELFTTGFGDVPPMPEFAARWRSKIGPAERKLAIYQTLADIVADRDEWRQQHENLLSVRESDLQAFARHRLSHLPQGEVREDQVERVARAIDPDDWQKIDWWRQEAEAYRGDRYADCRAEAEEMARSSERKADKNAEVSLTRARAAIAALSHPVSSASREDVLGSALLAVVDVVREYLPPDGIDRDQFINRVIAATDNPTINPLIAEIENGRP